VDGRHPWLYCAVGEREKKTCRVGIWQSRALVKEKKERNGTMRMNRFVITLLGTRAAVDDKMKNKATSADTIESLIIASML
jgi:hypothetical protein